MRFLRARSIVRCRATTRNATTWPCWCNSSAPTWLTSVSGTSDPLLEPGPPTRLPRLPACLPGRSLDLGNCAPTADRATILPAASSPGRRRQSHELQTSPESGFVRVVGLPPIWRPKECSACAARSYALVTAPGPRVMRPSRTKGRGRTLLRERSTLNLPEAEVSAVADRLAEASGVRAAVARALASPSKPTRPSSGRQHTSTLAGHFSGTKYAILRKCPRSQFSDS